MLFGGEVDVDHIYPRWRSLDDSYLNKVVSLRAANAEKGSRSPYEWRHPSTEYEEMIQRVGRMTDMPYSKRRRFSVKEVPQDASVHLNDTRYITREVAKYLACLYPPERRVGQKAIKTTKGRLTAELRRQWGLNQILHQSETPKGEKLKNREDHRHHAVDAIVIACAQIGTLQKYSRYWRARENRTEPMAPTFEAPWPTFHQDVSAVVNKMVVSHRVQRKIRGALHKETLFGSCMSKGENGDGKHHFVTRKRLDDELTAGQVASIRDMKVRNLVVEHAKCAGWSGKGRLPRGVFSEEDPLFLRNKDGSQTRIRRVRVRLSGNQQQIRENHYATLGKNHHMEFYLQTQPGGRERGMAAVVSTKEAARRARRDASSSIVRRDHGDDTDFLFSLSIGETVQLQPPDGKPGYYVVQKISQSKTPSPSFDLTLRLATDARPASDVKSDVFRVTSYKKLNELQLRKVVVDPLGRVFPSRD